jgi:transaldolase
VKLFLDTANIDEIRQGAELGVISGITTNPSLAAKEGIGGSVGYRAAVQEIADIVDGPISVEVVSTDAAGMIAEGRDIAEWIPNPWVKIPSTEEGFKAISVLARDGIQVNQTLVFSVNQALLGANAGSTVVSPFVGRLDDIGQDGIGLVADIVAVYREQDVATQVMAASIRGPRHCELAAAAGAQISTVPYSVLIQMIKHPLTDAGLARFLQDWQQVSGG